MAARLIGCGTTDASGRQLRYDEQAQDEQRDEQRKDSSETDP